ncbi:MAG: response regulator [Deltaproteobacteria bacterium]|nr:response regulator [Deltaproteobacteria bacterium]
MARALTGVSVLVVEDDADTRDLLELGLGAVGAEVRTAASAEAALQLLEGWRPDVILSDLQLPGVDGYEFLELLRAHPHLRSIPAVALSGALGVPRERIPQATFEKLLAKPSKLPAIVMALAAVAQQESPRTLPAEHPGAELRDVLKQLGAASDCRFTSVLVFSGGDTLSSIWTYDRDRPKFDAFPLGLPVHASYCVLVREAGAMCVIEDAATDPRTAGHPKRAELARYVGTPLFRADGTMFGTVCSYDSVPGAIAPATRDALATAARQLEPWLSELFPDGPSPG